MDARAIGLAPLGMDRFQPETGGRPPWSAMFATIKGIRKNEYFIDDYQKFLPCQEMN